MGATAPTFALEDLQGETLTLDSLRQASKPVMLPNDVASDREGNIYISDTENNRIRMVDKDGIIHTVAGSGKDGYSGDRVPATKAALNLPIGIALDGEGNLYITCHHKSRVRKVDPPARSRRWPARGRGATD